MVFIPPGTFRMGSPNNELDRWVDEGPQAEVIISRGFWMGKFEVTQAEYMSVMGSNPSAFTGDLNRPVEQVSWDAATNFCAKLTQQQKVEGRIVSGCFYRLPTEAEWEYACRALTSTRFSYGDDLSYANLASYAWYFDNSGGTTHPVGQKLPNPWGLYDMHGNVWEWCMERKYDYSGEIVVDPHGSNSGLVVSRGGAWRYDNRSCRSATRGDVINDLRNFGIRIILTVE
jgi:formylglycine-generating enzyme required for sulfatase activity